MAKILDLYIDANADFSQNIPVANLNIIDPTTNSVIVLSNTYSTSSLVKHEYTSTNNIPFIATINSISQSVNLKMTANNTLLLTYPRYVYDVILTNTTTNGNIRIYEGSIYVDPSVTH